MSEASGEIVEIQQEIGKIQQEMALLEGLLNQLEEADAKIGVELRIEGLKEELSTMKTDMKPGTIIKSLIEIKSDDREHGIDDGTPIVPIGTVGIVLGSSRAELDEIGSSFANLEPDGEDCLVVSFEFHVERWNFDVHPDEIAKLPDEQVPEVASELLAWVISPWSPNSGE